MLLSQLLTPQRIRVPLTAADKTSVIRELVDAVVEGSPLSAEDLLQAVQEREQVLSTGIGHGVAIPHGRSGRLTDLRVSAGVARHPIEFGSIDGAPVGARTLAGRRDQGAASLCWDRMTSSRR